MLVFEQIMKKAERICSNRGARLTPKRRQVLNLLLHENKAMSAYEIASKASQALKPWPRCPFTVSLSSWNSTN